MQNNVDTSQLTQNFAMTFWGNILWQNLASASVPSCPTAQLFCVLKGVSLLAYIHGVHHSRNMDCTTHPHMNPPSIPRTPLGSHKCGWFSPRSPIYVEQPSSNICNFFSARSTKENISKNGKVTNNYCICIFFCKRVLVQEASQDQNPQS